MSKVRNQHGEDEIVEPQEARPVAFLSSPAVQPRTLVSRQGPIIPYKGDAPVPGREPLPPVDEARSGYRTFTLEAPKSRPGALYRDPPRLLCPWPRCAPPASFKRRFRVWKRDLWQRLARWWNPIFQGYELILGYRSTFERWRDRPLRTWSFREKLRKEFDEARKEVELQRPRTFFQH